MLGKIAMSSDGYRKEYYEARMRVQASGHITHKNKVKSDLGGLIHDDSKKVIRKRTTRK